MGQEIEKSKFLPGMEPAPWRKQLDELIARYNHLNADATIATKAKQTERRTYLLAFFKRLREIGYKVEPKNINQKHILAACRTYESDGLGTGTIENYISFLRLFCIWIGKGGMLHGYEKYFSEGYLESHAKNTKTVNATSKPVDLKEALMQTRDCNPHIWHQLIIHTAFGLSRKETVMIRPMMAYQNGVLHITDGIGRKGHRQLEITNELQKLAITMAIKFVGKESGDLRVPKTSAARSMNHYSVHMTRTGISAASHEQLTGMLLEISEGEAGGTD
jgi:hypothetical protein